MAGVAPIAFFYEQLKALTNGPLFLLAGIAYLLLVRLIAEKFGKQ